MLVVVAAQLVVELVIPVHYGPAVTAITVLALGLFHLGAPDHPRTAAAAAALTSAVGETRT